MKATKEVQFKFRWPTKHNTHTQPWKHAQYIEQKANAYALAYAHTHTHTHTHTSYVMEQRLRQARANEGVCEQPHDLIHQLRHHIDHIFDPQRQVRPIVLVILKE